MSFNGSGTFTPYVPGNPVVSGTVISSTAFNSTISDLAAGLTNTVTRDGQAPPTANLPMGNKKLTGLAAGTVTGDSLRWEQLFSQGTEQDIASAATTDIGAQNTTVLRITGATTITSFGTNYNGPRFVRFGGVLTLTHNATTLILPGGANITTAAGDGAIITPVGNPASGWQVIAYSVADLPPLGILAIANGGTGSAYGATSKIQPIAATVNGVGGAPSNGIRLTINPTSLDFRKATLSDGATDTVFINTAIFVDVPSTATLGSTNAVLTRLAVLAINNAGTAEVAVVNLSGGVNIDESGVISTTALSTSADLSTVIYSTAARTGVPYRIVGFVEYTQATAGTYATTPSLVDGSASPLAMWLAGYGQTWQSVVRTSGTLYTNTTGRPIMVKRQVQTSGAFETSATVNGVSIGVIAGVATATGTQIGAGSFIVPAGNTYSMTDAGTVGTVSTYELR